MHCTLHKYYCFRDYYLYYPGQKQQNYTGGLKRNKKICYTYILMDYGDTSIIIIIIIYYQLRESMDNILYEQLYKENISL